MTFRCASCTLSANSAILTSTNLPRGEQGPCWAPAQWARLGLYMSVDSIMQAANSLPRLCIVDLDKTVWDSFSASATEPPYVRVRAPDDQHTAASYWGGEG